MRLRRFAPHTSKTLSLLLALILCVATSTARPMPRPARVRSVQIGQGTRPTLPPAQTIPARNYDTRHIKLDLSFDWEREQARGTATITFAPLVRDTRTVEFDAGNMTFVSVKLLSGSSLQFTSDPAKEKLRIALDRVYQPKEEITVVISYRTNGTVKTPGIGGAFGRGLAFIKPSAQDPARPRQIWSQGESEYNHYWFPCFDHPNDFATTEMFATVAKPFTVISNGKLVERRDNANNTQTFHWRMDEPHATYLVSIIVGEFTPIETSYENIPVTTYVYPREVNEGRISAARIGEMVRFFSEYTGVKYPYAKYAQTVVRDFGGGMENISATTLTDETIHDARAELDMTSDGLMSHELAHQWFGDLVTCRTWADIWLNESFATYAETLWTEKSLGRNEALYSEVKGNQDQYYQAWAQGLRRPIVTKNYREIDDLFDIYAYPRGGAVLHMLRVTLGDENFRRALNHYLTKYRNQPVETAQFRIAIEEATGQPMDWFFDEWVYKMGHPIFRVNQNYDPSKKTLTLIVRQEQKPDLTSPYPQADYFQMPVEIEIKTATNTRVERVQIEPRVEQSFTFTVDSKPQIVNFDYGNTLIKELRFEKGTDELLYQALNDDDVMGRVWAINELKKRLDSGNTAAEEKTQIATTLARALRLDVFWGARFEAANTLGGVSGEGARGALIAAATKDAKSKVRARAINVLAASKDATLTPVYLQALDDESYAVVRASAVALGETKRPEAYAALARLLTVNSWRDSVRLSGLLGLAALGDARALDAGMQYAAKGNSAAVRAAAINVVAATGKRDARLLPLVADALSLAASSGDFTLLQASGEALIALGDPRGLEALKDAGQKANNEMIKNLIEQFEITLQQKIRPASGSSPR